LIYNDFLEEIFIEKSWFSDFTLLEGFVTKTRILLETPSIASFLIIGLRP
jgi:hypothetical protein